jgi:hypothetical protein
MEKGSSWNEALGWGPHHPQRTREQRQERVTSPLSSTLQHPYRFSRLGAIVAHCSTVDASVHLTNAQQQRPASSVHVRIVSPYLPVERCSWI